MKSIIFAVLIVSQSATNVFAAKIQNATEFDCFKSNEVQTNISKPFDKNGFIIQKQHERYPNLEYASRRIHDDPNKSYDCFTIAGLE